MRLSKRLKAITEFVDKEDRIIDIGCDHALLDIYIKENIKNRKIIASDIHEGAIKQAKKNIEKYSMERKISLRLGDGLDVIKEGEVDTIIIAGMGYNNIEKILSNSEKLKDINSDQTIACYDKHKNEVSLWVLVHIHMIMRCMVYMVIMIFKHASLKQRIYVLRWVHV